jgi:predicted MFS family arabinose efflux permease
LLGQILFFYFYFQSKQTNQATKPSEDHRPLPERSPYRDGRFLGFLLFTTCYAVIFFQFFTTLPLYYREIYQLPESQIGLLLGFNGLLVFLFEMIIVHLIGKRSTFWHVVVSGVFICGFSFILLNLFTGVVVLLVSMILLTFSEIFAMPFLVTFTISRAGEKNWGAYIGLYTLAFSSAFILAPYFDTRLIAHYGYVTLWWVAALLSLPTAAGFFTVMQENPVKAQVKKEV